MTLVPEGIIAGFILVPLFFICIWTGYVAHTYTEKAEAFLNNSVIIESTRSTYSQAGLLGKVMRNGTLTMALIFKRAYIKKGLLNPDEARCFPNDLKRLLFISWSLHFLVCTVLIASTLTS